MNTPHYLRFVRSLTFASVGAVSAGCASQVSPNDGAVPDDPLADTSQVCLTACPATMPVNGTACTLPLSCSYASTSGYMMCACQVIDASSCGGAFTCFREATGPLPPPELPT